MVAEELPAKQKPYDEAATPPVRAMTGASLVGLSLTVTVSDPRRDLKTVYCDFTLVDDRGRSWASDFQVGYDADLPEAPVCGGTEENPLRLNRPMPVGVAFTIPQDAAPQVRFRTGWGRSNG